MNRRVFVVIGLLLAVVTIVLIVVSALQYQKKRGIAQEQARSDSRQAAASGTDFLIEGHLVKALPLRLPDEVRRGDSLAVVFKLKKGPDGASTSGLGNEQGGWFTPTLTVADCQVTAQQHALRKSTSEQIPAFVWQWSVDDCKSVGDKAVQLLLAFDGPLKGPDPVAYRELAFIRVTDSFSWENTTQLLSALTGLLSAVALVAGFFAKRKAGDA